MTTVLIVIAGLITFIMWQKAALSKAYTERDRYKNHADNAERELLQIGELNSRLKTIQERQREETIYETAPKHLAERRDFESNFSSVRDESASAPSAMADDSTTGATGTSDHSRRATDVPKSGDV